MKRTKIVCTIGPASSSIPTLVQLGRAGMDITRLNFSHGTHASHRQTLKNIQAAGKKLGRPFGVLLDLQGPKIRVGQLPEKGIKLEHGKEVVFSTEKKPAAGDIPVSLANLHKDVRVGERMLFDDGLLEVVVTRIKGRRIHARVVTGGVLLSHKGLNLPGTKLSIPALSEKDRDDALFGVQLGVDYMALSFVRSPEDVLDLRTLLAKKGEKGKRIKIIAKIEKQEALDRFGEILEVVDAIMVARGDLGVETPASGVPVAQKQMVEACREHAKPVIVATQMLDSMQHNPRPTRAEVSDVANAVADHADAVMLSGETASGQYPVETVRIMAETVEAMEASAFDDLSAFKVIPPHDALSSAAAAVRMLVDALNGPHIALTTRDGHEARAISSCRPETIIHAFTDSDLIYRQMRLVWGMEPHLVKTKFLGDGFGQKAQAAMVAKKHIPKGAPVVALSTLPAKRPVIRIDVV